MRLSTPSLKPVVLLLIAALLCAALPPASAQNTSRSDGPQSAITRWLDSVNAQGAHTTLALITFEADYHPAGPESDFPKSGWRLLSRIDGNTYLVYVELSPQLALPLHVRSISMVKPEWKLDAALAAASTSTGAIKVSVSVVPGMAQQIIAARLKSVNGSLLSSPFAAHGLYECTLPATALLSLASYPEVLYIGRAAEDQTLNFFSQQATKANIAHAPPALGGWGLLGDSVTVGVGDNVSGLYHIDLRDRIIANYNPSRYTNHGQHTNGTVGGAGIIDQYGEGFAPHANLVDHLYNLIWANTGAYRNAYNMKVTSNSYANVVGDCSVAGKYDPYAQVLDTIALQYPDVLHVFAAGNDGGSTCSPYPQGYATVTGGYQTSKNVLVVANSDKFYSINGGSSRGPIRDGRLKPEITAIGTNVYSTKGGDSYLGASGTSMACPQVAGASALLQQRYKQLNSGAYPQSSLLKALLMNGAMDRGAPGPDYTWGFGVMSVQHSLSMMDAGRYVQGSISNGATQMPLTITVPAGVSQLKVMLYWHDVPASPNAASQLVNDLDLSVSDPNSGTKLPLILNPAVANVTDSALPGADHRNNVEQVVIYNPAAGSYTVNVAGYNVPYGPQPYVVVYDFIAPGVEITGPRTADFFWNGYPVVAYWEASRGTNTFTLEYSTNNGTSWTTLATGLPADSRSYTWNNPVVNSAQCKFRITRAVTGETFTTGTFAITDRPNLQLSPVQCPGYANLLWNTIGGASGYVVYQKTGPFLQAIATTTDTFFNRGGLRLDSTYYFSVQPLFGAAKGARAYGISRMPATGNCSGTFSDGDLMVQSINTPATGRIGTSTELTASQTLSATIRNLDDAAAGSFTVSYQVNGGAWTSQAVSSLAALGTTNVTFTGLNLAAAGAYTIRVAVTNLSASDPIHTNDTVTKVVRQLQNSFVDLATGFIEDFESAARLTLLTDTMGFTPNEHWDYHRSTDTGRLRTFVDSTITISGNRSISMDAVLQPELASGAPFNRLTGTFNLASYDTASDEVRMEFDYRFSGVPRLRDSNRVWVRGADTGAWLPAYTYIFSATPGDVINSGTLSLRDIVAHGHQQFTSSAQLAFGQRDTSTITQVDYGNGITFDNIKLYKVVNDVGIARITSPDTMACMLGAATPLTVLVYNGVSNAQSNVFVYYRYDGGPVVKDTLLTIAGKDTALFTFKQLLNTSALGLHTLSVWLQATNDSYHANDSILNFSFRNEPLITSFPYLQDFEGGDGYWFSGGHNNSWAYGTPAAVAIHKAASGTKAWKTNLTGVYNDNELSYLYSPCFSIGGLSSPMLSFSVALQIENCGGTRCDGAWVEYAINGGAWTKLGAAGQGTNWYNSAAFQIWNPQTGTRWEAASIPLPATSQPIRFRFAFSSDPGTGFEGIAVDDIHIYNRSAPLYIGGDAGPITQNVGSGGFTSFTAGGALLAQINPGTGTLGSTDLRSYQHSYLIDSSSMQYYLPRNFVVHAQNAATDSPTVRLYVADTDVAALVAATGCPTCSKPEDAYELGVTKYHDNLDTNAENNNLHDNLHGVYGYIPYTRVRWVPYDAGYYAEFKVANFSELWFNNGGPSHAFPAAYIIGRL